MDVRDIRRLITFALAALGPLLPFEKTITSAGATEHFYIRPFTQAGSLLVQGNEDDDKIWLLHHVLAYHDDPVSRSINWYINDGTKRVTAYAEVAATNAIVYFFLNSGALKPMILGKTHQLEVECVALAATEKINLKGYYQEITDVQNLLRGL